METLHIKNKESLSNDQIKDLKKLISGLHENEHMEIFKIIKNDTDKFTENRNGIFINMSNLQDSTLVKIRNFVDFCNENKKSFQHNKDRMETIKNMVSEENNDNPSNIEDESNDNEVEIEYKNIVAEQYYNYTNNPEINLNDIENSLLKESINIIDNEQVIKKKKKYTGVKGRIMKKSRDNLSVASSNISNQTIKPIKVPDNIYKV